MSSEKNQTEIRSNFPFLKRKIEGKSIIYLDNGASTQKPKEVIDAITEFYQKHYANIHRGVYTLSEEATELYEGARLTVAEFIKAKRREIVFTKGTTESLNLLAATLPKVTTRREIVLTELEHHANILPWMQLKAQGFKIHWIKLKQDYTLDMDHAKQLITSKTAIVACTHISNVLGTEVDIKKICAWAKQAGAYSVIDAAQSIAHEAIDVKAIGCDFLACSGHKMFGPTGIGVLYGRHELLEQMPPYQTGGDMIKEVSKDHIVWHDVPHKFEAGTPNIAGAVGLAAACRFITRIGTKEITQQHQSIRKYAIKKISTLRNVELLTPKEGAPIISLHVKGAHPHDLASLLNDENICVRAGHHCAMPLMKTLGMQGTVRISLQIYNTEEEIDLLVAALKKAQEVFV